MLEELTERIRSIDFNRILDEVLGGEIDFILGLIRLQLSDGEGGKGGLGSYSGSPESDRYVDLKHRLGLFQGKGDPAFDLFFSGDFYSSLVINIKEAYLETLSTDPKLPSIEKSTKMRIGTGHVLELSEENLEILRQMILPKLQKKINDYFGI